MNKISIKVAALCMSAAMMASAVIPSLQVADVLENNAVFAASADQPVELIKNNTFETGTKKWGTYLAGGGDATMSTKDGKLALKIKEVGKLNYGVQLFYDILPIYQNGVYRLRFDISCDTDRYVEAMIQQNGGTYQSYVWKGINLTNEVQTIDTTFTMKYDTDIFAKLVFNCGNEEEDGDLGEHTIYLDNAHLELIDDSKVDYTGFEKKVESIITNQVGYLPDANKKAVFRGENVGTEFYINDADTKEKVFTGKIGDQKVNNLAGETDWYGDFTEFKTPGKYFITTDTLGESLPFSIGTDVYSDLLNKSVYMFYLQRCGTEVKDELAGHDVCHNTEATIYGTDKKIDVTGGWHDAGDYGRYTVAAAKAVADMLLAYQKNPDLYKDNLGIPESGNSIPDILDEVRYELEWMLKMQDKQTGGAYHKVTCQDFPGFVLPEEEKDALYVTPVSTTATADFCATMAMAYETYKDVDKNFADKCLAAAESAWTFLEKNPNFIFQNIKLITTGEYGDTVDSDERYWAAAQMYKATGNKKYADAFAGMVSTKVQAGLDWSTVGAYGNIAYLSLDASKQDAAVAEAVKAKVLKEADSLLTTSNSTGYGTAITKYNWGSNMTIANCGTLLYIADSIKPDAGYAAAADEQLNYLLGKNALGTCFVTGFGSVSPENPHHRPSMVFKKAVPGMLVGGVNSSLEDSAAEAFLDGEPAEKCYIDNDQSYSTNEITIYWNSPLVYLLSDVLSEKKSDVPGQTDPKDLKGDTDCNGSVTAADVVSLMKAMVGKVELSAQGKKNADMNDDGKISIVDLILLKNILAE